MRDHRLNSGRDLCRWVVFLITAVLLSNCAEIASRPTRVGAIPRTETIVLPTGLPTLEPTPSNTRVLSIESLTPAPTATITPIPDEVRGLVVEVIDGNTIAVVLQGDPPRRAYEVRYLGIDAPAPSEPWGQVALETNRRLTNLKVVRLVRDETDLDDEGRLLRYVYVDNQLTSIILAEQGLANANIIEPDTRFADEIQAAEALAQEGNLGIWGDAPPTATATRGLAGPGETPGPAETVAPAEIPAETEEPTPADETTPSPTRTPIATTEADTDEN